ncbi:MAG: VWA domain-containing protein [Planctomycetota bacterium]|nr:VWA domain-containing protein [Planctomycetota bacterium]
MVAAICTSIALALTLLAELLQRRRCRALGALAFGQGRKPALWARSAPMWRMLAAGLLGFGLPVLLTTPPKVHKIGAIPEGELNHLVLVLDVSPSMRLLDAGPTQQQSRMHRAREVMESFFRRVPLDQYRISVIATYNGAKPVVVDTKDLDVVRNILGDLPMHFAFPVGPTDIFAGLREAAKIAEPWRTASTVVALVSDGDSVPAMGMPKMPAAVRKVLVVGIGDPTTGRFIDGRQSRQDRSTLRQVALRLGGIYHDGNEHHLTSDTLLMLSSQPGETVFQKLTLREYALLAIGLAALILSLLPFLLHQFGNRSRHFVRPAAKGAW